MIRAAIAIILAACLWQADASAQGLSAAQAAAPPHARSAALSPSGAYVALIEQTGPIQSVRIFTLASGRELIAQQANVSQGVFNWVAWKGDDRVLVSATVLLDGGDFAATRVVSMDREGENVVMMFENQRRRLAYGYGSTFLLDALPDDPDNVLLTAWDNDGAGVWRANVHTGRVRRDGNSMPRAMFYYADGAGEAVLRVDLDWNADAFKVYRRASGTRAWLHAFDTRRAAMTSNAPDFAVVGPGPGPNQVYVIARPPERDLSALFLYDASSGQLGEPIQSAERFDVATPWVNPRTRAIIATCEDGQRLTCVARDESVRRGLSALQQRLGADNSIALVEASEDGARWLVFVDGPRQPGAYLVYSPADGAVFPIAQRFPAVDANALSATTIVSYRARDGMDLWAYVTRRSDVAAAAPMVVMPHGGPEARDVYGYDGFAQFLASRGYVVVQPHFRGSIGSGRLFADAGRMQWGQRMQDDVTDAVRHMIDSGVADAQRICIVGASYGGYAALAGATLTPELYRCAVSISGVSDLNEVLRAERREGANSVSYQYWLRSIGDPRVNAEAIAAASPRLQAGNVTARILLIHGEDDTIVPIQHSEMMDAALRAAGRTARFVRLDDEGHFWSAWTDAHRREVFEETGRFLDEALRQ